MAQSVVQPTMNRLISTILALVILCCTHTVQAQMEEQVVKAAYIYNFLRFTEWPTEPKHPFNLCILGHTPLDSELHLLEGQPIRTDVLISVTHVSIIDDLKNCQAIYLNYRDRKQIDAVLRKLHRMPALTISDAKGVADRGVMIELGTHKQRVTFDINLKSARLVDMNFSARLLKLARYVTTQ